MLTGKSGLTIMPTFAEMAGLPVVQASLDVKTHLIALPFAGMKAYVELVAPGISTPLSLHWYFGDEPPLTGNDE